jgi:DNA gyrase subunit A
MMISQFGKIIRIDTKSVRAVVRATVGVKFFDADDRVATTMVIPKKTPKYNRRTARCCDTFYKGAQEFQ